MHARKNLIFGYCKDQYANNFLFSRPTTTMKEDILIKCICLQVQRQFKEMGDPKANKFPETKYKIPFSHELKFIPLKRWINAVNFSVHLIQPSDKKQRF